jgi:hypothetical protein
MTCILPLSGSTNHITARGRRKGSPVLLKSLYSGWGRGTSLPMSNPWENISMSQDFLESSRKKRRWKPYERAGFKWLKSMYASKKSLIYAKVNILRFRKL